MCDLGYAGNDQCECSAASTKIAYVKVAIPARILSFKLTELITMKKLLVLVVMLMASLAAVAQTNSNTQLTTATQCTTQVAVASKLTVLITVGTSTWAGTLQAQGVDAQGNTYNVSVTPTNTTTNTPQATIAGNGAFNATVHGFNYFQVCGATITSGSANVTLGVAAN